VVRYEQTFDGCGETVDLLVDPVQSAVDDANAVGQIAHALHHWPFTLRMASTFVDSIGRSRDVRLLIGFVAHRQEDVIEEVATTGFDDVAVRMPIELGLTLLLFGGGRDQVARKR